MKVCLVRLWTAAMALALAACGGGLDQPETSSSKVEALDTVPVRGNPTGKLGGTRQHPPAASHAENAAGGIGQNSFSGYGIDYHDGPIMLGTVNVYYIYYGNWTGNSAPLILKDFMLGLSGSPYHNIETTYYDGAGRHVSNSVRYQGSYFDTSYAYGTNLSDANIQQIVANALGSGAFPVDANGVYFVLTSSDVTASSGFCTAYCGWHWYGTISGANIKYSFVGNGDRCPSACQAQTTSPNGNAGADGMASVVAHELEEAISDPNVNAWYDSSGEENADKCAWSFGTTYTAPNGSRANVHLDQRDFYIQQNWVNAAPAGYCALGYGTTTGKTTVVASSANTVGNTVYVNDPFFNGHPNLVIEATHVWNPGGVGGTYVNHPIGVWYDGLRGQWGVFHQDSTSPAAGEAFNLYASYATQKAFTHLVTPGNMSGDFTWIDDALTNGNPNAKVLATPSWNPPRGSGIYDTKNLGVWYDAGAGKWAVFHQDYSAMTNGEAFNVLIPDGSFVTTSTSANSSGDTTYINNAATNGRPGAMVFAMSNWNPGGAGGTYLNHPIGVWYSAGMAEWAVYTDDITTMPLNESFNIWVAP